ncbi:hypothetical protein BDY21DRAFT_70439 [Lineolata rhizophorae]|uniref:Uncharacterized protein n=1 Tax=Lineolata rhizophorae TaxID=578093 RepID=A0A6A6NVE5_9PEZI|nr:hypothetical protein BDY21DRAFT_70439 [Lineolata rhizophorae]
MSLTLVGIGISTNCRSRRPTSTEKSTLFRHSYFVTLSPARLYTGRITTILIGAMDLPPYCFGVWRLELTDEAHTFPQTDDFGRWDPPTDDPGNAPLYRTLNPIFFHCQDNTVTHVGGCGNFTSLYSVYSVQYDHEDCAFWIVNLDASTATDFGWRRLRFNHDTDHHRSEASFHGTNNKLLVERPDQQWPSRVLTDAYRATGFPQNAPPENQFYGTLHGDLALILGLLALSVPDNHILWYFSNHYNWGRWNMPVQSFPRLLPGANPIRGVVVKIYLGDDSPATRERMRALENGIILP